MRRHYRHLEGIRGLSALLVVLSHTCVQVKHEELNHIVNHLLWFVSTHGHSAVTIFIVLSGYCLMLPVAFGEDGRLRGGFRGYIFRRARRILPPYYVALFLSILALGTIPNLAAGISPNNYMIPGTIVPGVTLNNILAHVFLVHNLNAQWCFSINWSMWSVSTEWQIYFAFPVLLWIWRKAGRTATVVVAYFGSLLLIGITSREIYDMACFHYLGSFAMGMAAGSLHPNAQPRPERWSDRQAWLGPAAVLAGLILTSPAIYSDTVLSAVAAGVLITLARFIQEGRVSPFLKLFDSPVAVTLGKFSYSLYLTHLPFIVYFNLLVSGLNVRPLTRMLLNLGLGVPLAVGFAFVFYLAFEYWTIAPQKSASADPGPRARHRATI